jgi:hypothetical protein
LRPGYANFNSMNQTLAVSGVLARDVSKRLGETGQWLYDVARPHGLERYGEGFINTIRVRLVHALVRRAVLKKNDWVLKKNDWDLETWGLPINQLDMVATYLALGPVTVSEASAHFIDVRAVTDGPVVGRSHDTRPARTADGRESRGAGR